MTTVNKSVNSLAGRPTAAELGYRLPAEWERLAAVWVTPPHNEQTWPGCLPRAQEQFEKFLAELRQCVQVISTTELGFSTDDSWIRDYAPQFVKRDADDTPKATHDFRFNAWGRKYPNYACDDRVAFAIAEHRQLPVWRHDFVLEGGSIDVDGVGTLLTTEQCLLNPNRNPNYDRRAIETKLHDTLGATHIVWLKGGITGDDTDGHIDDVARFIAPNCVAALRAPRGHIDAEMLDANWQRLVEARTAGGERLSLVELPMPEPIDCQHGGGESQPLPASYANFLIANGRVFVPVFAQATDDIALTRLADAMPNMTVVPIRSEWLVVGMGALHCLTMHEPA